MTEIVRPWRGVSAEDRRAERLSRLHESVLNVVGAEGVAATTVEKVCADAKLTKRYFYESFADLDTLLVAALDVLMAELLESMDAAVRELPAGNQRTHAVVEILIDALSRDPRRARLYVECPGHPQLRARRDEAVTVFTSFVATKVLGEPADPIGPARRLLATRMLVGGTTDLVTSWLAGDLKASRKAVIETIERLGAAV